MGTSGAFLLMLVWVYPGSGRGVGPDDSASSSRARSLPIRSKSPALPNCIGEDKNNIYRLADSGHIA
jgi:hypothetical protein